MALANSLTAAVDVVSNSNMTACPGGCFRPVGLAWDSRGRLYMSSDSTGEIYVVTKADGSGVADVSRAVAVGPGASSSSSAAPTPTSGANGGMRQWGVSSGGYWVAGVAAVGAMAQNIGFE